MIFYKTSSFGNDFIEIDRSELADSKNRRPLGGLASAMPRRPLGGLAPGGVDKGRLAREICDRQRGVGADGVVFYSIRNPGPGEDDTRLRPLSPGQGVDFQIFNRDGGEAELSGNGMAGLSAVLLQRRLARSPLALHAAIGSRRVELLGRDGAVFRLAVEIGLPDFANRDFFPFLKQKPGSCMIDGLEFHPVSVGNPHAVVICRELPPGDRLAALGKKIEGHAMFPKRVNVEFVEPASDGHCRVYFYERGVGPTLASSTGSAAVFAVLRRLGKVRDRLDIDLDPAGKEVGSQEAEYPAGEDPAGKEFSSHGAGYPAGGRNEKIAVSWKQGIFIHNITRLICRGEFFL
jgi:diaminopimelate epimerase